MLHPSKVRSNSKTTSASASAGVHRAGSCSAICDCNGLSSYWRFSLLAPSSHSSSSSYIRPLYRILPQENCTLLDVGLASLSIRPCRCPSEPPRQQTGEGGWVPNDFATPAHLPFLCLLKSSIPSQISTTPSLSVISSGLAALPTITHRIEIRGRFFLLSFDLQTSYSGLKTLQGCLRNAFRTVLSDFKLSDPCTGHLAPRVGGCWPSLKDPPHPPTHPPHPPTNQPNILHSPFTVINTRS